MYKFYKCKSRDQTFYTDNLNIANSYQYEEIDFSKLTLSDVIDILEWGTKNTKYSGIYSYIGEIMKNEYDEVSAKRILYVMFQDLGLEFNLEKFRND